MKRPKLPKSHKALEEFRLHAFNEGFAECRKHMHIALDAKNAEIKAVREGYMNSERKVKVDLIRGMAQAMEACARIADEVKGMF